jgi:signal transduction histidine kinase/CheY-like chemotaxis protein
VSVASASDTRVLVIAPTAKDVDLLQSIFAQHGIIGVSCSSLENACAELDTLGAGALMVAEETLIDTKEIGAHSNALTIWLKRQPAWSDLPILVLARPGADSTEVAATHLLGNVTILERPMRVATMVSAVQSALRARHRQYQIREHLAAHASSEAKLRANDQRKDEFLAILAHELRNPLAPISNALHILNLSSHTDPETSEIGRMMERQIGNMKRLIDDLLEVSRVTRGEFELRFERAELATIIDTAIEASQPLIAASRHRLTVSLPKQPLYLRADVVRLAQVVSNLLNNAAKYTPADGHITLTVEVLDREIAIYVTDNGVGIAPELQSQIFEMFMQVDQNRNRAQGGLGIGLTLVKRLVEMHGGSVDVFSAGLKQGSRFSVRLPILQAEPSTASPASNANTAQSLSNLKILIADDNQDSADTLALLLKHYGASVEVTYNGTDALNALDRSPMHAAILDIGMSDIDGIEVARRIRAQKQGSNILLIALTGWGQKQDMRDTKNAGFDYHLTKPVDVPQLLNHLVGAYELKI